MAAEREDTGSKAEAGLAPKAPAKRQRVSLACDTCRAGREKCDGVQPRCGTCTVQNRECSYTPTSRKRGLQTGYLRAVELSLAWVLEEIPEAEDVLCRLMTQAGGAEASRLLKNKTNASRRLHKRWSRCRAHKEIGILLSEDSPSGIDYSDGESGGDGGDTPTVNDTEDQPVVPGLAASVTTDQPKLSKNTHLQLPCHWQQLIDIYFKYTHCWLPLTDRAALDRCASEYGVHGIVLPQHGTLSSIHAELWAVLALAAFQQDGLMSPKCAASTAGSESANHLFHISRKLVPMEEGRFELSHLRAMILHCLMLIGQNSHQAAWLVIGKASRLALSLLGDSSRDLGPQNSSFADASSASAERQIISACYILDTISSRTLGQPNTSGVDLQTLAFKLSTTASGPWEAMRHTQISPSRQPTASASRALFNQLYKFANVLGASKGAGQAGLQLNRGAEDIVKSLDPEFGFCNSLVQEDSTPAMPSAYLLHATFLAVSATLSSNCRRSLLNSFLEVVESCVTQFTAYGTPPLMVALLTIVYDHGEVSQWPEAEKLRWLSLRRDISNIWLRGTTDASDPSVLQTRQVARPQTQEETPYNSLLTPTYNEALDGISGQGTRESHTGIPADLSNDPHTVTFGNQLPVNASWAADMTRPSAASRDGQRSDMEFPVFSLPSMTMETNMPGSLDYDALMDELGSITGLEKLDTDPNFMTNLGFAPGCDLDEMFQGYHGV